jgi:hypothetical protein
MPYCLYNDLILEQIKLKKKELANQEKKNKPKIPKRRF